MGFVLCGGRSREDEDGGRERGKRRSGVPFPANIRPLISDCGTSLVHLPNVHSPSPIGKVNKCPDSTHDSNLIDVPLRPYRNPVHR